MMNRSARATTTLALAIAVLCTLAPSDAHAYVDPGILGQLYQLIYVAIFGGLAALVTKPHRFIAAKWREMRGKKEEEPAPNANS